MIGQAFSGWLYVQGDAGRDPVVAKPYMNDFVSAVCTAFGTLAAYIASKKTGKGQVVDVAQFEAMAQYMCGIYTSYSMVRTDERTVPHLSDADQVHTLRRFLVRYHQKNSLQDKGKSDSG